MIIGIRPQANNTKYSLRVVFVVASGGSFPRTVISFCCKLQTIEHRKTLDHGNKEDAPGQKYVDSDEFFSNVCDRFEYEKAHDWKISGYL